jgi:hypothetical protein
MKTAKKNVKSFNEKKWLKLMDRLESALDNLDLHDLQKVARKDWTVTVDDLLAMREMADKLSNLAWHFNEVDRRTVQKLFNAIDSSAYCDLYNYDDRVGRAMQAIEDQWYAENPQENF